MARRPGGVDSSEINVGFEALQRARSAAELDQLIENLPVLGAPIFHVRLKDERRRQITQYGKPLPDFIGVYDYLFMRLQYRAHKNLIESAGPPSLNRTHSNPVRLFAPPYFLELATLLGDRSPKAQGPTLSPATAAPQIRDEIEAMVGRSITLPNYEPSRGSHWSLNVVSCASCRHVWLKACAYGIDLTQAPSLIRALQEGKVNNSGCPRCSEVLCFPLRIWLQDEPGAGDILAALTCAWKVSDSRFIYQPPPGTPKIEQNNYIIEIRFDKLLQRLGWDLKHEGETSKERHAAFAIGYTIDEVSRYIGGMMDTESAIPFAMHAMILEITRKLKSGLLPISDAIDLIGRTMRTNTQNWPIVISEDPLAHSRDPYNHLVLCLVAESSAEVQTLPAALRTVLAARTYGGFFSVGEVALAEVALVRAEDLLKNVPANDPGHTAATVSVVEARSQLFSFLGRHVEADHAREHVGKSPLLAGDTLTLRLARQQLKSQEALSLKRQGRLADALKMYPGCVAALELMEKDAASPEDKSSGITDQIRQKLSGDLANWAAILITLGEQLETIDKLKESIVRGASPEDVSRQLKSSHMMPDELPLVAEAIPVLEEMYPAGFSPEALFEEGRQLLSRALALSEASKAWEFAGIQAHRLAALLQFHFAEIDASQSMMQKAIDYASRVGDHRRVSSGYFFLAELAIKERDGPKALAHLLVSAREEIREQVGSGYYAQPKRMRLTLSDAAFRTVAIGGDKRVAVMIAESMKIPTTAAAMVSGLPVGPGGQAKNPDGDRLSELLASRERLRLEASQKYQVDDDVSEVLRHIEIEIAAKRKALSLRDSRFSRWVDATNLDVSEPQAILRRLRHLGPRTTLLGILPIGLTVWTYAIWDDGCIVSEQLLPSSDGNPPRDYVGQSESREIWDQEYLEHLSAALLDPLEVRLSELRSDDRLIISTSDPLALVPFSALPYRGEPLCSQVCITQIQGVGMLEACLDRRERLFDSLLCIGNPDRRDWPDLPGADVEAATIAGRFRESGKSSVLLAREDASLPNLKAEAGQHDVLHFACHAALGATPGDTSRLILAPDLNLEDSGDLSEDRILSELPLREGCLVNLAGCQTGVQDNSKGFLLGGLVPSFLVAGAGSVIGSLWQLDDDTAACFQMEFYRFLLDGNRPAESLTKTQRACLSGDLGPAMQDMNTWAAYAIYGVG